jgi:phenylalanyl-tRNA synthetase beta chain
VRIVHEWLSELVDVPPDVELVAREISLRGFEVASVEDGVIDFEITANRPDCLNHVGIAREASVIWDSAMRPLPTRPGTIGTVVPVTIDAPDLCPRYAAQLFEVTIGPSPAWLTARLEAAGVRPISNIVDVTNYVMLEMGQPMHAFDLEKLSGGRLVIRRARAGEQIRTLDGIDRVLDTEMLVIADAERAVAIGGVMGGESSEIGSGTRRIVLESAYFHPPSVRRTSKKLGLKTEASTRFERGADIDAPLQALARAAALFEQIGAAKPGPIVDVYPSPRPPVEVRLRGSRISRVLGIDVPAADVARILNGLAFGPTDLRTNGPGDLWTVTVPPFRPDVTREIDLIEEVGRHVGYDKLPVTFPVLSAAQSAPEARIGVDETIRRVMTAAGLSESMTFAFIERHAALPFCPAGVEPAAIANPLSEKFAVLRPSLLPGLIESCSHNRRRGLKDVRLFEIGSRFTSEGERRAVGFAWAGAGAQPHWSAAGRGVDFFDVKGVVELLTRSLGLAEVAFAEADTAFLVRGRAARITTAGTEAGVIGQLSPSIAEARGLPAGEDIYVAELDLDAIGSAASTRELRAETLPRYPAIVRDLSILIGEALPAAAVRGTIRSSAPTTLASVAEFDRYQGKGVPEGRVSLSLRLTFRSSERTLTDDEVEAAMAAIVDALQKAHGAERR